MLDPKLLRDDMDAVREAMRRRGKLDALAPLLERAESLAQQRRLYIQAVEERKAARNAASQEVARRKRAKEDAQQIIVQTRALGEEIARLERELAEAEGELDQIQLELPNMVLPDVHEGGEEDGRIVREWGTPRKEPGLKPHWELGEKLGLLDLPRGAKVSGSGFIVFRGAGARLVR